MDFPQDKVGINVVDNKFKYIFMQKLFMSMGYSWGYSGNSIISTTGTDYIFATKDSKAQRHSNSYNKTITKSFGIHILSDYQKSHLITLKQLIQTLKQ